MKVVAIIQARMGSTRLPGKVLKKVLNKTLLDYQIERVKRSAFIDEIVVATTNQKDDDAVVALCEELGVQVYRGSEDDVLSRYYETAQKYQADLIVRLTSDCPLIDWYVIDDVIQLYLQEQNNVDYVSNALERTFPRGLDTEVFSFESLKKAYDSATTARDREHVTAYFYTNPKQFRIKNLKSKKNLAYHRWTVDTIEDFELIKYILEELYPKNPVFTTNDILQFFVDYPSLLKINAHIEQKKL